MKPFHPKIQSVHLTLKSKVPVSLMNWFSSRKISLFGSVAGCHRKSNVTGERISEATNHESKNRAKTEKLKKGEGDYQVTFSLGLKL